MNIFVRSSLAVAAFTLFASAGAGATARVVRPAGVQHSNPALLAPHIGSRKVIHPDIKCKAPYLTCGELYASSTGDYLEYEWCVGYGSDPCDDLYTGSVVWYAFAYKAKNDKYEPGIFNYLVSESSSGSDGEGTLGNPVYQYVFYNGAKVTNGKYKYADYTYAYYGSSSEYASLVIGIGVY
jgi:hypothetical protein